MRHLTNQPNTPTYQNRNLKNLYSKHFQGFEALWGSTFVLSSSQFKEAVINDL